MRQNSTVQIDNNTKNTAKESKSFSRQRNGIFLKSQVGHLISAQTACFPVTEDKSEGRDPKTTATESSCSEGLAEHLSGGNVAFGDVHELQTPVTCFTGLSSKFSNNA